jgi:hypothetical protein
MTTTPSTRVRILVLHEETSDGAGEHAHRDEHDREPGDTRGGAVAHDRSALGRACGTVPPARGEAAPPRNPR